MPPNAKLTTDTSTANLGVEATAPRGCASLQSTAILRSLSEAKDNRFLPVYQFAACRPYSG